MPAAYTSMLSVQVSDFEFISPLIQHGCLLCGFCSSGQRFACGFLQIPPRGGHPCRPANTSPCRVCGGLSPPSRCALPGAPNKNPGFLSRGFHAKISKVRASGTPSDPVLHSIESWRTSCPTPSARPTG
jgi:hypothetical protein